MSLLTDEEIKLLQQETHLAGKGHPFVKERQPLLRGRRIAQIEHTKTLKDVAELVNSRLNGDDLMKLAELLTNPLTPASKVKVSVELTALELRMLELGKMPGEE